MRKLSPTTPKTLQSYMPATVPSYSTYFFLVVPRPKLEKYVQKFSLGDEYLWWRSGRDSHGQMQVQTMSSEIYFYF